MSDNYDLPGKSAELLKDAIRSFSEWAAANWTMKDGEAEALTDPSPCPKEYERGYNAGVESLPDAVACWMEELGYD